MWLIGWLASCALMSLLRIGEVGAEDGSTEHSGYLSVSHLQDGWGPVGVSIRWARPYSPELSGRCVCVCVCVCVRLRGVVTFQMTCFPARNQEGQQGVACWRHRGLPCLSLTEKLPPALSAVLFSHLGPLGVDKKAPKGLSDCQETGFSGPMKPWASQLFYEGGF